MAYAEGNPKTKKQLREWLEEGRKVPVVYPGMLPPDRHTRKKIVIEGPHFPMPHTWYAYCEIDGGLIVKVIK